MFNAPRSTRVRTERIASTVGFVLLLATWVVTYTVVCPDSQSALRDHHLAKVAVR